MDQIVGIVGLIHSIKVYQKNTTQTNHHYSAQRVNQLPCRAIFLMAKFSDWQLCVLWHPPTRRLVWAANSLLCSVHLSFSPARPLMRLDAVCILCLQRSASSSRVWLEGRADKEVSRLTYQCSLPVCPSSCLYINPHLNLIRPFVLCTSVRI